jgi:hypothetical protein
MQEFSVIVSCGATSQEVLIEADSLEEAIEGAAELYEQQTPSKREAFQAYKKRVWAITSQQPLHTLENYDKRGFDSYHVDHTMSIWDGFRNGVAPEIVGWIGNLSMIEASKNMRKSTRSWLSPEALTRKYEASREVVA